jgi:hypothetical protein
MSLAPLRAQMILIAQLPGDAFEGNGYQQAFDGTLAVHLAQDWFGGDGAVRQNNALVACVSRHS